MPQLESVSSIYGVPVWRSAPLPVTETQGTTRCTVNRAVWDLRAPSNWFKQELSGWIAYTQRCQLSAFARVAKRITHYQKLIRDAVANGLFNARSEATNTHPQLLIRRADRHRRPHPRRGRSPH